MADWLCGLALAGLDWRDLNGQLGEPLQQWMSHSHGLEMSHLDDELQSRGLHLFRFDSREYDRTSHLQLDDHVSFDKVGRVYFAMDRDPYRIVVDHVGTKLYKPGRK